MCSSSRMRATSAAASSTLLIFLRDLLVHRRDRAIQDLPLFLDAFILVNGDDFVRDIGGLLRVGIVNADLEQIGIAHFVEVELAAQNLVGLLARRAIAVAGPFVLQFQVFDHRVKNAGALNDLINRRRQLRIVVRAAMPSVPKMRGFSAVDFTSMKTED